MNYCDKIKYTIYQTEKNEFPLMVEALLNQIAETDTVVRLAFFGTPADNEQYITRHDIIKSSIRERFGDKMPAISYVSQPPLNAPLILEVHSYHAGKEDTVLYKRIDEFSYVLIEKYRGTYYFAGGFQSDIINNTIAKQSIEVFEKINCLLEKERFPVNSIIRQWNYIEQITACEEEDQNYQSFNNARSDFYATTAWENGYPAATGIGTNLGGVLIDFDAVLFTSPHSYATSLDNKLQIAAHAYSGKVLARAQKQKATPKFERAKRMTFGDKKLIYISGTAAIRGEESLKGVGLQRQLQITMENIYELIGETPPVMLRVYLKNKEDYEESRQLMDAYKLDIPISYMWADVCREELLIEIEGIAIGY